MYSYSNFIFLFSVHVSFRPLPLSVATFALSEIKEKPARYVSRKDFISQWIKGKHVPKGLELTLEPTIGNYDHDFTDD